MRRYYYFIFIFLLSLNQFAQDVYDQVDFEHLSLYDGLSQNAITCMIQDSKGFIWLGTQEGLNRFDGYFLKIYKSKSDQIIKLSNSYIVDLAESYSGKILICTQVGLDIFDITKDSITSLIYNPNDNQGLKSNELTCVWDVKIENDEKIFIGSKAGLNIYNEKTKTFQHFYHDPSNSQSISSNMIFDIIQDSKGHIWIGTQNGINLFNPQNNTFSYYFIDTINTEKNQIKTIFEDKSSNLWVGTFNDLYNFIPETGKFITYEKVFATNDRLSNHEINAICQDNLGNFYIGTPNGLNFIEPKNNRLTHYLYDAYKKNQLSNNFIFSLITDQNGNIWIGTYGGGVNKINNYRKKFINYTTNPNSRNSLNVPDVLSIYEDEEEILWIGTHGGGLNKFDRNINKYTHYKHDPNNPKSICHDFIRTICEDQYGKLWLGTDGGGICIFDKKTEEFINFKHNSYDSRSLAGDVIRRIIEDYLGNIWIATFGNGLDRYDRENNNFIHYKHDPNNPNSIGSNNVYSIYENDSYELWITTMAGGISKYNRLSDNFTVYRNIEQYNSNWILYIHQDKEGNYWLAADNGLLKFDEQNNSVHNFGNNNEILNSMLYAILEDSHGNLWISSNHGLSKFNPFTEELNNYSTKEGVKSKEFWGQSCFENKNGEMFFGGIDGITIFYPDSIIDYIITPQVYLMDLKIFDKSVNAREKINNRILLKKSILATNNITLTYKERSITFEFAAVNFINPENTEYAYILEGFDKDWNYVQTRRFATFTNLPAGDYVFKVKASTNNGKDWSTEPAQIEIKMLPPFWKTWWFILIIIIIIIGSISYWYWNKLKQIKKQNILLEEKVIERTKEIEGQKKQIEEKNIILESQKDELASQRDALIKANNTKDKFFSIISHDLKSPFNALLGFSEILTENLDTLKKEKIRKFSNQIFTSAKQLYNLVENLLSWSRSKSGKIKSYPEKLNISQIVSYTKAVLVAAAEKKGVKIESFIKDQITAYADENLTSTILRNLISNAIKYSKPESIVTISAKNIGEYIKISVADLGVGISKENLIKLFREDVHYTTRGTKEEKGTGLGLILCKEFVEKSGGEIWVESKVGKGTTFYFTLPVYN